MRLGKFFTENIFGSWVTSLAGLVIGGPQIVTAVQHNDKAGLLAGIGSLIMGLAAKM